MGYSETRDSVTALVKEQADIVQIIGESVDLKRSGARFLGCCPFHGEKTPSFSVHPGQQFYHCFGCGESGDVFSFMMKYHNIDFPSALKELARRYQIELPEKQYSQAEQEKERLRKAMYAINDKAARLFREYLLQAQGAAKARAYLERRGIPPAIQEKFQLGYAPSVESAGWNFLGSSLQGEESAAAEAVGLLVKNDKGSTYDRFRDRILFPIFDPKGRISGFGGRIVGDGQPKYMNSPESPIFDKSRLLLGLFQQAAEIRSRQRVVLVEGNFDMVSLVVHGCLNVVAPLGTALTRPQLKLLRHYADNVILLFDGDAAGVKAAVRAVPLFLAEQMSAKVALLPPGHDPDTFVREKGLEQLERLLDSATPLAEFALAKMIEEHGLTLDGKSRIVEELRPLVQAAASPLQRSVVIAHFSEKLGIATQQLTDLLSAHSSLPSPVKVQPRELNRPVQAGRGKSGLNGLQNRLVGHMVRHPRHFVKLEKAGLRQQLAFSVGEILFLQIKGLCDKNQEFEPEDLLAALPEGEERALVAEIQKVMKDDPAREAYARDEKDLVELLLLLKKEELLEMSRKLYSEIKSAPQGERDYETVMQELLEMNQDIQKIDKELRALE
ncbi:MAG: DNA primase [Proteobacteria bacterium]|jgi:DNA primase|nr:DNA primase [Desulfocapsa sp.]MBU3945098.1 DNA primase [Pseudomonadota bacterium]MCG2743189.1 DNA primase [Desulfobacteraceae bacterium]MBU3982894.1 DNA primase [Pseudomonadota bacterium]MBU4028568.1 DNA primase [Pseudomonadota bacterium]